VCKIVTKFFPSYVDWSSTYWRKLCICYRRMLQNDETDKALPDRLRTDRLRVHCHFPGTTKSFFFRHSFFIFFINISRNNTYALIGQITWTKLLLRLTLLFFLLLVLLTTRILWVVVPMKDEVVEPVLRKKGFRGVTVTGTGDYLRLDLISFYI